MDKKYAGLAEACLGLAFYLNAVTVIVSAQTTQSSGTDDLSTLIAAVEQTTPTPADEVPANGIYYSAKMPDAPILPGNMGLPAWNLGGNVWLVDDLTTVSSSKSTTKSMSMMSADDISPGDGGTNDGNGYTNSFVSTPIDTNGLWLEIINYDGNYAYLNLMNGTDAVYAVEGTEALPGGWGVETELFPADGTDQTNCLPFTVATLGRTNLFMRAVDWTGVETNGLPCWWTWLYFGNLDETAANLDTQGLTLGYDYANGITTNFLGFIGIETTNSYFNFTPVPVQLDVAGYPYYVATLVDDTNFAEAVWNNYNSPQIYVNIGLTTGWHDVWVGLRGHADDPTNALWQEVWLNQDYGPSLLVITNPASTTVSVPVIQLQGYAAVPLASLTYDISNADGLVTNQPGYLTSQFYDTNVLAFTLNYFQCYDVPLTNGLNTITLHATDLLGNETTTNLNFTLDYSADTTAPALSVVWPADGTAIAGNTFTLQAQVDDATAGIVATIVDASGNTNTVPALVERDGMVWAQNLPLGAGANTLTITATDAAGNTGSTSETLYQSSAMVTLNPLTSDQLNQPWINVSGTVSDDTVNLTVNGVDAYYTDDTGDWEADGVPVNMTGTAILDVEVSPGDSGSMMAVSRQSQLARPADDSGDTGSGSQKFALPQPAVVVAKSIDQHRHSDGYVADYNAPVHGDQRFNWTYAAGGSYEFYSKAPQIGDWGGDYSYSSSIPAGDAAFTNPDYTGNVIYWYYAAVDDYTYSDFDTSDTFSDQTQMRVMIKAQGQEPPDKTSTYLVLARAEERSDPADVGNYSEGDVPLPPEWLQINGQTLINTGVTNADYFNYGDDVEYTVWGATTVQGPSGTSVDVTPVATQVNQYQDYTFQVQAVELLSPAVDANRDGQIALDGSDDTTVAKPYRFWVNDSQENGDVSEAANAAPGSGSPNYALNHVNGRADLVNFFPVALCLSNVLQWLPPTNGWEYHLSQADSAVKFVYSSLAPTNAFDYLTNVTATAGYGVNGDEAPQSADTIAVSSSGTKLDTNWLAQVQNNGGNGVVLMEGCATTTQPLMLEIWKNGQKLGGVPLYISISGVEQMYRWINLRHVTGETETRATDTSQPANYPDSLSDGKQFVFVHGYNVNEQSARGWSAEMFKRLYQARSKAMFTAVTWYGEEGQWPVFGITPDYYENVVNAFDTASNLAVTVNALPGQKYIAGHSLGNMVVSSAIADWGLNVNAYFAIDAAVAMEAYNSGIGENPHLVPTQYWPNYHTNLWASYWFSLFPPGDNRTMLTWQNRFGNIPNAYNYYSSTEDVLANADGQSHTVFGSPYAWMNQEMYKGSWASSIITLFSHSEAGWSFNIYYSNYGVDDANAIPNSKLMTNSFFGSFSDSALYGSGGSAEAAIPAAREKVLADGIPALSNAAGANYLSNLGQDNNRDMSVAPFKGLYANGLWPREKNDWQHSDIVNIAYPFNRRVFEQIITDGGLR